ncbi:hypothetical protein LTR92_011749 [Exophiala xenobiotica]|nr:hypothetical protein LTR92_011749 [Exophiala xenobiotica]
MSSSTPVQSIETDELPLPRPTGGSHSFLIPPIPHSLHHQGSENEWEMAIEAASKKPFRNLVRGWEKAAQQGDEQVKAEDYICDIEIQVTKGRQFIPGRCAIVFVDWG